MTRRLEPVEHIAQAIIRLFSSDGVIYRVDRVEKIGGGPGVVVALEAVTAGQMILVAVAQVVAEPAAAGDDAEPADLEPPGGEG